MKYQNGRRLSVHYESCDKITPPDGTEYIFYLNLTNPPINT